MPNILDFVQMAAEKLGTPEPATREATGSLLRTIEKEAPGDDFQKLLQALPGAADLLKGGGSGGSGGGLMGALGQAASGLGGGLGSSVDLLGSLQQSGLNADKIGPLVTMFLNFIKSEAGQPLVSRLLAQVPMLSEIAG